MFDMRREAEFFLRGKLARPEPCARGRGRAPVVAVDLKSKPVFASRK